MPSSCDAKVFRAYTEAQQGESRWSRDDVTQHREGQEDFISQFAMAKDMFPGFLQNLWSFLLHVFGAIEGFGKALVLIRQLAGMRAGASPRELASKGLTVETKVS